MQQTRKIIGQIFDKKIDKKDKYTKYSFIVRNEQGKSITLGLFISNKDNESARLKKEGLAKDFKKGDNAEFIFYDKTGGNTTYHNIVDIKEVSTATKEADETYNIAPLVQGLKKISEELTEQQKKDIGYLKKPTYKNPTS